MEIGTVRQIDIDQEMQGAYLDYAMSVIVSRALPDVRDGLKPVHRRILYAMYDMGLRPEGAYKKSARIVGEVLGKYHPHGDAAVYEAMARMAQDFSLRYMLVDGQGNFGSIDGDSPAAMRYTEARMAPVAMEMLADIDKETVDFVANFDDTLQEPAVLPAILPNLLINGASGIAVGMTTNIPPHNAGEVCDALAYLIDHYNNLDGVMLEELTQFIQGPDFPTGGVVYRYAGEDGDGNQIDLVRNAYALGRGRLTVQAQVHIEEMSRNRSRIVISELPYQVNKTRLIERIAELVRDGRIEGITDLRDESDRQGMRICIELTRTVEPREILSQLFKLTPMQTTFGLRMLALVDGEPRLLSLKRVLIHYLEHRQEIITRRSRYMLERAKQRAHILEGLLKALDAIDKVIDIIRGSRTPDTARSNLMARLKLTDLQAQAILDMPLKRLAALERRRIADEHAEKLKEITQLQSLLRSPAKIRGVIREELLAVKARYGDARRTRIVAQEKGHHTARDLVEVEDVLLTLWRDGQASRSGKAPRVSSKAVPVAQTWGNTQDDVAFFTASGQAALAPLHQIPQEKATPVSSLAGLDHSEALVGALVLPHSSTDKNPPHSYLTMVTRGGRIKRTPLADFVSGASRDSVTAMNVEEDDNLVWVGETFGQDELLLVTRQGKAIRFPEEDVRAMGLSAAGVLAVKLGRDDAVVAAGIACDDCFVVLFTEKGYAKRTAAKEFPAQKRYGGGVQAIKLSTRTGRVARATLACDDQNLVLLTDGGRVTTLPVQALHPLGRATTGYKNREDNKEAYFDPAREGAPILLTVLAGTHAPGQRRRAESPPPTQEATPTSKAAAQIKLPTAESGGDSAPRKTEGKDDAPASTAKKTPTTRSRATRSKQGAPKQDKGEPTQMALPLKSTPAKAGQKTTQRKPRTVRSVPQDKP